MKIARLIRLEKSEQGMLGVLLIDSAIFCYTLELDNTFIKQGCYECSRFHGDKWKDTFELRVPGHTAVLFHSGNTEVDTKGCILLGSLPGKLKGNRAILNSGDTFKSFLTYLKDVNCFTLFIENRFL